MMRIGDAKKRIRELHKEIALAMAKDDFIRVGGLKTEILQMQTMAAIEDDINREMEKEFEEEEPPC